MAQSVLSIRMDTATKEAFARFCDQAGMSVSTAVNVFAKQTIRNQKMPFTISLVPDLPARPAVLDRRTISQSVQEAASAFPAITSVVLFGSYARGEANPESDIDLRITYDDTARFSIMNLASFSARIEQATGKSVDIISKRTIDNPEIAQAIETEGVALYER